MTKQLRVAEKVVVASIKLSESFHVFGFDAGERTVVSLIVRSILRPAREPDLRVNHEFLQQVLAIRPQRFKAADKVVRDGTRLTQFILRRPVYVLAEPQTPVHHEPNELFQGDVVAET